MARRYQWRDRRPSIRLVQRGERDLAAAIHKQFFIRPTQALHGRSVKAVSSAAAFSGAQMLSATIGFVGGQNSIFQSLLGASTDGGAQLGVSVFLF